MEEYPTALIVEDKEEQLDIRKDTFSNHNFQIIGVQNLKDALDKFRGSPAIDIVIIDINLNEGNDSDQTGVAIAKEIKLRKPSLPIIAYSGKADELSEDDAEIFKDLFLKGQFDRQGLNSKIVEWKAIATEYRKKRLEQASQSYKRFGGNSNPKHNDPKIESVREYLDEDHITVNKSPNGKPEEVIRAAGWTLKLLQAGLRDVDGKLIKLEVAVPFWLKKSGSDVFTVILHQHELVYATSDKKETSINNAIITMRGYFSKFKKKPVSELSEEESSLKEYLNVVFNEQVAG